MEFDNTNSGALFKGDKKTEKHPDYTGSIDVGGVDHWISAWIKTSKAGKPFMSLSVTPKDEKKQSAPPAGASFSEDIPFAPCGKGLVI